MNSKGSLGSIVAGVIAIFLVIICVFYLSFTWKGAQIEEQGEAYATMVAGEDDTTDAYTSAYKHYMDSVAQEPVYLGYTYNEVQRWGVGLGLDLKGGMNVTLQVNMGDMLKSMAGDDNNATLRRAVMATDSIAAAAPETDYVETFISQYSAISGNPNVDFNVVFPDVITSGGTNHGAVAAKLKSEAQDRVNNSATNVLRNRIDAFGVVSPNIQVLQGKQGQILLELPGVKEHERVRDLLQRSANLEFYEMYNLGEIASALQKANEATEGALFTLLQPSQYSGAPLVGYARAKDKDAISKLLADPKVRTYLPANLKLAWSNKAQKPEVTGGAKDIFTLVALRTDIDTETGAQKPRMNGDNITTASSDFDNMRGNTVHMNMNSDGARAWAAVTRANVGKPVAIVLDDLVYSYPTINTVIEGGQSEITGDFTLQEAQDLANVLKSGKMTARVSIISDMVVGPSLGQQAINDGLLSFVFALILLMVFMIAVYGVIPGLVANLGLVLNIFFTFGILASFQAVLTLSGIAGIVLALGMAVDANVLIFERAKEELRAGKNARNAIADGYSNAFSAIFDSNLTSIITGVILLLFGTGPIKGFATTLIIGICCSFFTAVYLTRIVFILGAKSKAFQNLTFTTALSRNLFNSSKFDFLGCRKISFALVGLMIAAVVTSLCLRGMNQGIDFSGGRNYVVKFEHPVDAHKIQETLAPHFPGASVSVITIENANQVRVSTNYKINDTDPNVESEVTGILYDALAQELGGITPEQFSTANVDYGLISSQKVGPSVADDMKRDAYIAVTIALIAMFLYILIRFRNVAFSLGALAAVAFTALTIIGFYSFFWGLVPFSMEIDQTFIAAILTVIGYQINDTVVVFDRVRENIQLYPKHNMFDQINRSINSTLGRTVMTSLSTLLVLVCIFILGGEAIRAFTFAMISGVVIGTLSTIFVAAPVAYLADRKNAVKKA
ncbi:protein translocase subunit SecDF [Muribaculaceae bacterium]|jgi:SecD/SecF fusion protein|nr:protein translocase subunit SecD [Muribaculaceae bacterium]GFI06195.1 protein translocase subunit SecDF [Muribaculaceae bacterium]